MLKGDLVKLQRLGTIQFEIESAVETSASSKQGDSLGQQFFISIE